MDDPQEVEFAWLLISGISITFLLAIAVILFVVFYQKQLFTQQIRLQEIESEYQRNLLVATTQAQENEQKRIASDLHDEVGAVLSASKLYLTHLSDNPEIEKVGQKIRELIDTASQNLRNISHNISPQNLEKFGLISALSDMSNRINGSNQLTIHLNYNQDRRLKLEQELALYRITQELLNNTLKYANASNVVIDLEFTATDFYYNYKDDGVGVDLNSKLQEKSKGLGLRNLEGRAELLDTKVQYQSAIGEGFQASLNIELI